MQPEHNASLDSFGLLATGTAGCWSIDLDESHDGNKWSLQLDGPQVYLAFALRDLAVVRSVVEYLRGGRTEAESLPLGSFASADVSLRWDNEYTDRCFLIVGGTDGSALRVTLSAEDTSSLAEALEQILEDLPDA